MGGLAGNRQVYPAADAKERTAHAGRVCRAWHRANGVQGPVPGVRGAEGEEKDKGVTVRGRLKEVQSKDAGRRTGT